MKEGGPKSFQVVEQWAYLLTPLVHSETLAEIIATVSDALDDQAAELEGEYAVGVAQNLAAFGYSVLGRAFWQTEMGRRCIPLVWSDANDVPLTFREAASLAGTSVATIQREIERGNLSRFGSAVSRASIGRWIASQHTLAHPPSDV
ncbi:hypothetical protein [Ferrimicrobium acidiphilum]|uniref:hypothetical protein n=1 Tax=Ferrimicrobium acidiphilum TaxID=121039 RepID=UPI0023F399EB|nr:hypothetical protein [Ferrimicrobium acidiphilum]